MMRRVYLAIALIVSAFVAKGDEAPPIPPYSFSVEVVQDIPHTANYGDIIPFDYIIHYNYGVLDNGFSSSTLSVPSRVYFNHTCNIRQMKPYGSCEWSGYFYMIQSGYFTFNYGDYPHQLILNRIIDFKPHEE